MASHLQYAQDELNRAGLFDPDADYKIANSVMKLIKVFSQQEHSESSAVLTLEIFVKLAQYQPPTPITSNPDE